MPAAELVTIVLLRVEDCVLAGWLPYLTELCIAASLLAGGSGVRNTGEPASIFLALVFPYAVLEEQTPI